MGKTRSSLGTFEITSGKMVVSDPCYKRGTWCAGILDHVKNGVWNAVVSYTYEGDVRSLRVQHKNVHKIRGLRKHHVPFDVGVDSGQAGFFDDSHFFPESSEWYDKTCHLTNPPLWAGIIVGGAVSRSGYGDGCYDCYYYTDDNDEVVAAVIWFI